MFTIRKTAVYIETIYHEGGPVAETPLLIGGICVVVNNPFAGRYEEDFQPAMEALKPVGLKIAGQLIAALGCPPDAISAYGKGTMVGVNGELEHGALWHVPGGYAMRELLGDAKAIVPSSKKVTAAGGAIDIPITHINASYVRGHFNALELRVPDSPRPNELVFCLVMGTGGRIHQRMGGLQVADIKGEDGQR